MNQEKAEVCGTCRYHRKEAGEWVCMNPDSDLYSDYTEYMNECENWEARGYDRGSGYCI